MKNSERIINHNQELHNMEIATVLSNQIILERRKKRNKLWKH